MKNFWGEKTGFHFKNCRNLTKFHNWIKSKHCQFLMILNERTEYDQMILNFDNKYWRNFEVKIGFSIKKNRRELETCKGAWSQFSNLSNIIKRTFNPCIDVSCVFRNHQILLFESPPKSSFVSLKNSARYSLHAITLENFPYKQRLHITRVRAFGHKTSQLWLHVPSITDLPALSTSQQTLLNKYNL